MKRRLKCEKWLQNVFESSEKVKFRIQHLILLIVRY